jgi:hypothetical protein
MSRRDNMSTYLKTGMEKVFVDNEKKLLSADGEKIIQLHFTRLKLKCKNVLG